MKTKPSWIHLLEYWLLDIWSFTFNNFYDLICFIYTNLICCFSGKLNWLKWERISDLLQGNVYFSSGCQYLRNPHSSHHYVPTSRVSSWGYKNRPVCVCLFVCLCQCVGSLKAEPFDIWSQKRETSDHFSQTPPRPLKRNLTRLTRQLLAQSLLRQCLRGLMV